MEFIKTLTDLHKYKKEYISWDKQWDDKDAQRKAYYQKNKPMPAEQDRAKRLGKTIVHALEVMDENSEDNTEAAEFVSEQFIGLGSMVGMIPGGLMQVAAMTMDTLKASIKNGETKFKPSARINKIMGSSAALNKWGAMLTMAGALAGTFITIPMATRYQKKAMRISHYQSSEELKDPRKFVVYDNEQLEQARQIAKTLPDEKPKKIFGLIAKKKDDEKSVNERIKNIKRDYKAYLEWKKNRGEEIDRVFFKSTPEEIEKAKADQDVLLRIVKKVNDTAEEYSENAETSMGTFFSASAFGGMAVGVAVNQLLHWTGVMNFIGDKVAKNVGGGFKSKYMTKLLISDKFIGGTIMAGIGSAITNIITSYMVGRVQVKSAHIGRFVAKRELEQNPDELMYCSDKQLQPFKNVKSNKKKGFIREIIDDLKFFKQVVKDSKDYIKYEKESGKKKKLIKALDQVPLKPGQEEAAKNLQYKVFKAFDKVDEMSQVYSEDAETLSQMIMQSVPYIQQAVIAALFGGAGIGAFSFMKNKGQTARQVSQLVAMFFRKGALKGYLKDVMKTMDKYDQPLSKSEKVTIVRVVKDFIKSLKVDSIWTHGEAKHPQQGLSVITNEDILRKQYRKKIEHISEEKFRKYHIKIIRDAQKLGLINEETAKKLHLVNIPQFKKELLSSGSLLEKPQTRYILDSTKDSLKRLGDMTDGVKLQQKLKTQLSELRQKVKSAKNMEEAKKLVEELPLLKLLQKDGVLRRLTTRQYINKNGKLITETLYDKVIDTLCSGTKKDLEHTLKHWENIANNLPGKEFNQFVGKLVENPDKAVTMIENGDLFVVMGGEFIPLLAKVGVGGISGMSVLSLGGLWLYNSFFAEQEKLAGRVGTMKAIQSLSDPRHFVDKYHANGFSSTQQATAQPKTSEPPQKNDSRIVTGNSMINKYLEMRKTPAA